jgi:hypothetical protein
MAKTSKNSYYLNNPNLPTKGATFDYTPEMVEEIDKCKEDLLHFAENYFYILNIDEGRIKIKLYEAQKKILRGLKDNRFFCLLASRQVGKSTIATIFILWMANFFPDQKILLVANKESTAIEIFGRVRMAYEMLPVWLKSPVVEYAKTAMELENGSSIKITTTTGTAGRGSSCSLLIIDEAAFIESHLLGPFWASVFPIISSSKKAKVFMCSTANGTGNLFHQIYTESIEGKNNWGNHKILWSDIPGRDETWKEEIKSGLASNEKWEQEFDCQFINSGTSSLNEDLYKKLKLQIREPIETLMNGKYKIFERPEVDKVYVAGVDVSDGVGGDYSVIKILDITDLMEIVEVAEFYDNTTAVPEFTNIVYEILGHWGRPLVCIERNNQGGQVVDRLDRDFMYEGIVSWGAKKAGRKSTELLGMISARTPKYYACANARYFYNDRESVVFRNDHSLEELFKDFVKVNDSWQAVSGKHDDRTMALIWALMVLDKELVDLYFTVDEVDKCGKVTKITPIIDTYRKEKNFTSIYTNEEVEFIEHSNLMPVSFGNFNAGQQDMADMMEAGWEFPEGSPHYNPSQHISSEQWELLEKYF